MWRNLRKKLILILKAHWLHLNHWLLLADSVFVIAAGPHWRCKTILFTTYSKHFCFYCAITYITRQRGQPDNKWKTLSPRRSSVSWKRPLFVSKVTTAKCFQLWNAGAGIAATIVFLSAHLDQIKGCFVIVKQDCVMLKAWIRAATNHSVLERRPRLSIQTVPSVSAGRARRNGRAEQSSANWTSCLMFSNLPLCLSAVPRRWKPIRGILDIWKLNRPNVCGGVGGGMPGVEAINGKSGG